MVVSEKCRHDVDQFLLDRIDAVPHLEAFLLIWRTRPKAWTVEEMAVSLFLSPDATRRILEDLSAQHLVAGVSGACETYTYASEPDRDQLVASLDAIYRRELIRVSTLIHSKPSAAVRDFARAFRLKKDRE
jgi:hypothetical protein